MQGMAEKEEKPKEDSDIFTEIEDYTKEGYLLLQNGDVVNSCLAYEKAMQLALETKESFTERACFFNLGACCVAKGETSKGVEFLLRACPPDKESDGSMNFADLHYNLGVGYDFLGQPSKAKRCYETALEGYKSCSNMQMEGQVFLKLGGTLTSLNLLEKATEVFYEGEKIFQKLMDQRHEVLCLSSRATLMAEMRNEQCQELLKVVVNRVEELRDDLFKAKIYSDIGLVYTSTGLYDNAAECLGKSFSLIKSTEGDQKLEASVCQNLGAVHNQLGSYMKASVYHEKAIELYGLLGNRYAQGHSFCNLGFAFGQLGELDKSREYFMHALQAAKDCQDHQGEWQANEGLSAVCFHQKDYEKAVSYLKSALTVLAVAGVNDKTIHERIVAKLANALESHLSNTMPHKLQPKTAVMQDKFNGLVIVDGTTSKVGFIRPREKNHKLIAQGLELDERPSDAEESLSDSTFDSISSYSGSFLSTNFEEEGKQSQTEVRSDIPGPSRFTPMKKDPLNNTYEEPQDIIQVLESGELRLHNLPPGPRDAILASIASAEKKNRLEKSETTQSSSISTKSRICVLQ